jgi:hypothetical protein
VLLFNGQEVGETGAGFAGFSSDDGRTTNFDYWCMPELVKWVNGHAYDGGGLSQAQHDLRRFYAGLLALCQDPSARADGYWGLKYFNRAPHCPDDLYTFARFEDGAGRLLVVAANFRPNAGVDGRVRLPQELVALVGLPASVTVRLVLDRTGTTNGTVAQQTREELTSEGFPVSVPNQTSHVYVVE